MELLQQLSDQMPKAFPFNLAAILLSQISETHQRKQNGAQQQMYVDFDKIATKNSTSGTAQALM